MLNALRTPFTCDPSALRETRSQTAGRTIKTWFAQRSTLSKAEAKRSHQTVHKPLSYRSNSIHYDAHSITHHTHMPHCAQNRTSGSYFTHNECPPSPLSHPFEPVNNLNALARPESPTTDLVARIQPLRVQRYVKRWLKNTATYRQLTTHGMQSRPSSATVLHSRIPRTTLE